MFKRIILFTGALILSERITAQIDDVGVWVGAGIQKSVTRNLDVTLSNQLRLHHDVTDIDAYLIDAGLEYALTKKLKTAIHYRFINSNEENYYSKRHRFYADVSWREKIGFLSISLRERIQEQYKDYYSSEDGKIPVWTLRTKINFKFDLNKKYSPYLSGEIYYLLDNAKERDNYFSRYRIETGIEYEINRMHSINPFILFQHEISPAFDQLIYGLGYTLSI